MESGAAVADLVGKDIDWSCGRLLSKNRGLFATDPKKAPLLLKHVEAKPCLLRPDDSECPQGKA